MMELENIKPEDFISGFEYKDIRTPDLGYTVNIGSKIDYSAIIEYLRKA